MYRLKNAVPEKNGRKRIKLTKKVLQTSFLKYSFCAFTFYQVIREMLHKIILVVEVLVHEYFNCLL